MISFDEAIERIKSLASPIGVETVPITEAAGRVLAAPVVAMLDSPRRDVSAMDGYAVRAADLGHLPARLRILGSSFPGASWSGALTPGTCARVFTGASIPGGADLVVVQENVRRDGDVAIIETGSGEPLHVRRRGSDFVEGDQLLPRGRLLDARSLVAVAGADLDRVEVFRSAQLHVLGTGDELAEPGTARKRIETIPESMSVGVAALGAQWGATHVGTTLLRDDLASMRATAQAIIGDADVIVVTGGASVGEKDFAKEIFAPFGLELIFANVSIKPGKPFWIGRVGDRFIVGLPGNPTSALVTSRLLLAPLLAGLHGRDVGSALNWKSAPLRRGLESCGARETFHRATIREGQVDVLSFQDSSAQKVLAEADLLVRQAAGSPSLSTGDMVEVLDF